MLLPLPACPPAFATWPDDVSKVDVVCVARTLYLWQVLAPQCMPKSPAHRNRGRGLEHERGSVCSPNFTQGSVAAASPRRGWPDDCDSRDAECWWGLLRRDCGRRDWRCKGNEWPWGDPTMSKQSTLLTLPTPLCYGHVVTRRACSAGGQSPRPAFAALAPRPRHGRRVRCSVSGTEPCR
jgi:hypothetical protein